MSAFRVPLRAALRACSRQSASPLRSISSRGPDPASIDLVRSRGPRRKKVRHDKPTGAVSDHIHKQPSSWRVPAPLDANQYHAIYLRDACTCEKCVDPDSGQKHVWTADIPTDIAVKSKETKDGVTEFTWINDVAGFDDKHVTRLNLGALVSAACDRLDRRFLTNFTWDRETLQSNLVELDYNDYIGDDKVRDKALCAVRKTGLAIVHNVPESEQSVVNIAERIGPLRNSFYGMTWDVRSVPNANNVAYTSGHLGFHMDLLYMKVPPRLQFLHCLRSASKGGASLFVDAFKVVLDIAREDWAAFVLLSELHAPYHYIKHGKSYYDSKPFVSMHSRHVKRGFADVEDMVRHIYCVNWSPMFQGNLDAINLTKMGRAQEWLKVVKMFREHSERQSNIFERHLKPGSAFIFDNRRLLHARTGFEPGDVGKERWLKGCYVDLDPYESRLWQIPDDVWKAST